MQAFAHCTHGHLGYTNTSVAVILSVCTSVRLCARACLCVCTLVCSSVGLLGVLSWACTTITIARGAI